MSNDLTPDRKPKANTIVLRDLIAVRAFQKRAAELGITPEEMLEKVGRENRVKQLGKSFSLPATPSKSDQDLLIFECRPLDAPEDWFPGHELLKLPKAEGNLFVGWNYPIPGYCEAGQILWTHFMPNDDDLSDPALFLQGKTGNNREVTLYLSQNGVSVAGPVMTVKALKALCHMHQPRWLEYVGRAQDWLDEYRPKPKAKPIYFSGPATLPNGFELPEGDFALAISLGGKREFYFYEKAKPGLLVGTQDGVPDDWPVIDASAGRYRLDTVFSKDELQGYSEWESHEEIPIPIRMVNVFTNTVVNRGIDEKFLGVFQERIIQAVRVLIPYPKAMTQCLIENGVLTGHQGVIEWTCGGHRFITRDGTGPLLADDGRKELGLAPASQVLSPARVASLIGVQP